MNNNMEEENGIGGTQENGQFRKLQRFSSDKFWNNVGCLLSASIFGLEGSRIWEKDTKISGSKGKRSWIQSKVDLYEVCASLFQIVFVFIISILILIFLPPDLLHISH